MNFKNQTSYFPPSPNAAALAKYAEIPVNLHTGIPQIGVPIYSWKSKRGNSAINISLSYHAGGIKVEDVASSVGLGWSLNAGGVISRSVRGLPDDDALGYINTAPLANYNTSVYNGGYYLNPPSQQSEMTSMNISPLNIIAPFNDPSPDNAVTREVFTGFRDSEQDMFYYNVNGYTGKFVLDKDGNVNKIDVNELEISVQYTLFGVYQLKVIQSFTIQADDGIKYIFEVPEVSSAFTVTSVDSYSSNGGSLFNTTSVPKNISSSYYVSKAIDLNSPDTIYFYYSPRTLQYVGGWSESVEYHDNDDPYTYFVLGQQTNNKISSHSYSYQYYNNSTRHINRIALPDKTTINFFYDQKRADLDGDTALTRIEISDLAGNSRKFLLRYSYFDAAAVSNVPVYTWNFGSGFIQDYNFVPDHFNKRLRLDNVKQVTDWINGDSITINAYQYNDTLLPPRNSKEIDYWGYYYGPKRYAYTLIPQIVPAIPENPQSEGIQPFDLYATILNAFSDGANRTPDALYARASVLKKIVHPTGGYTSFQFSTNTIKDPIYPNSNREYFVVNSPHTAMSQQIDIPMPGRSGTEVMFYISFERVNADGSTYIPPPDNGGPYTCFENAVGMSQITFYVNSTDGTVMKQCDFNAVESGKGYVKVFFALPLNKTYYLYYVHHTNNDACLANVYFKFETSGKYITDNNSTLVGGLRVDRIDYFDPVAGKTMKTFYSYAGDDGYSSGMLPVVPNFNHYVHAIGKWSCCNEECGQNLPVFLGYAQFKVRSSSSTQTLSYNGGSNTGYGKVAVSNVNSGGETMGKTVTYFSGITLRNQYDTYPFKVIQVIDWASGHKTHEYVYDRNNVLVKRAQYNYYDQLMSYNNEKNRSVKMACIRTDNCAEINPIPYARYVANAYYPFYGRSLLTSKREVEYRNYDSMVAVTNYGYFSNTGHLASVVTTNSKSETTSLVYHYPSEYSSAGTQLLVANKVKGTPIASRSFILPSLINQPVKEVKAEGIDYATYGSFAWPQKFSTLAITDPTTSYTFNVAAVQQPVDELVGQIMQYDAYGNACEVKGKDGVIQSVIWGYNYTMPIAKITGMGYNNAVAQLQTITLANLQNSTDENLIRSKINEIRQANAGNPAVQVVTYTYKPLIGTTSETDGSGKTIFYEYDGFGRLILVRDFENNIIKKICYNYAGQVDNCGGSVGVQVCNQSNCTGNDKKCINGICETGQKICTANLRINSTTWLVTYHYLWSDGSVSVDYQEQGPRCLTLGF